MKSIQIDLTDAELEVVERHSKFEIAEILDIPLSTAEKYKWAYNQGEVIDKRSKTEDELTDEYIAREQKSKQRFQDNLRITRKQIREQNRMDNAILAHHEAIRTILENNPPPNWKRNLGSDLKNAEGVGVIQLSDLHLNELVEMANNTYDFKVASQRLQYLAKRAKKRFKDENVKSVLIVGTGDWINSDRRLDELLAMATNRSMAEILSVMLIEQFILDIATDFPVEFTAITGNESRLRDHHSYGKLIATDNYDFTIKEILKLLFRNNDRVKFIELDDPREGIINVCGHHLMIMHGDTIPQQGIHKRVSQIKSKIASKYDIVIDYVIWGHIHSAYCSESFSRSGSLVGANCYSDDALALESKASQNIYIFKPNYIEPAMIDLQNPVDVDGYNIDDTLEAYNAKSAKKAERYIIHQSHS